MTASIFLQNENDTQRLARHIAKQLHIGSAIMLFGNLGAGKTALARHIIRAYCHDEAMDVVSPTFSILQVYESESLSVTHADLHRLDSWRDIRELNLEEALQEGMLIIEWPERIDAHIREILFPNRLELDIVDEGGEKRRLGYREEGTWKNKVNWLNF